MDSNPISIDLGRVAQDLQIRRIQVESVVQLLDEGNTIPFITRYRKERTGGLNEVVLREIERRIKRLRDLAQRKETILKAIEGQGRLSDELREAIRRADSPKRLEDLYLPYKPKKRTKASDAREKGLEPLALRVWNRDETLTDLPAAAAEYVNAEKGLDSPEKVLEGVMHILAESISELANVRETVRRVVWRTGRIGTVKAENQNEKDALDYRDYFDYSEPVGHVPPHRVLAINRGDKTNALKVRLDLPREEIEGAIRSQLPLEGHPQSEFFTSAAMDALDRLLLPSLEREVRRDLTEMAEGHAVDVYARNLRSLFLQPRIEPQVVLAVDPGFRTGCKVAVLDGHGGLIEHGVIYPHQPHNRRHEAKLFLKHLVGKHGVQVVAIGNGTACRETEELVAEIIAEGTQFHQEVLEGKIAAPLEEPSLAEGTGSEIRDSRHEGRDAGEPSAEAGEAPADDDGPKAEGGEGTAKGADPGIEAAGEARDEGQEHVPLGNDEHAAPAASALTEQPEGDMPQTMAQEAENIVAEEVGPGEADEPSAPVESNGEASHDVEGSVTADEEAIPPVSGGAPDENEERPEEEHPEAAAPAEEAPPEPAEPTAPEWAEQKQTGEETSAESGGHAEPIAGAAEEASQALPDGEAVATGAGTVGETSEWPAPTAEEGETAHDGAPATPSPGLTGPPIGFTAPPVGAPPVKVGGKGRDKKPRRDGPKPQKPKGPPPPPAPHPADPLLAQLSYVIVNEAGASVYSASPVGKEEFPDHDATLRGTISIGRRLLDPLAELVKIEPQNIGVGLYQHDINPRELKESLESVIESCVNFVGVELNSASVPLLRHVSGLNELTARRIVERRQNHGPYTDRAQIREVEGVGPVTFTQAAAFLKIRGAENPLDRTWVHPENYEAAQKLFESLGLAPEVLNDPVRISELHAKLNELDVPAKAAELDLGEPTLYDLLDAIARPDRDPREDLPKPIFKKGVLKLEDLSAGMELKGTVLNVVDFGAFVDIGLKDSGLVHISQLANRYIKSPHEVVSVGDVVSVWVMGVDQDRKRVSLSMVAPGTERARPTPGDRGPRRGPGGPPGDRGERRGPGGDRGERPADRGERRGPPPRRDGPGPQANAGGGEAPAEGAGGGASSTGPRVSQRIPGPPQRAMGGRGGGRFGGRPGGGGGGRGGPGRGPGGFGGGRPQGQGGATPAQEGAAPAPKPKPSNPSPLSKDALTGNAPLRTFGQLAQFYKAKGDDGPEPGSELTESPGPEAAPEPSPATE